MAESEPIDDASLRDPAPLRDPGDRGTLTVRDRVVERTALAAARNTDGVASGTSGITRRASSRIKLSQKNSRVVAEVATKWPRSVVDVGTDVRQAVAAALTDAGITANSIDVTVTSVVGNTPRDAVTPVDLPTSREPRSRPGAARVAVLLALVLIGIGVVGVRDALVEAGALTGQTWTGWLVDAVNGTTAESWMVPVGIALAVVGLLLIIVAVKPRARRHRATTSPDVWIHRSAVAPLVRGATASVTGADPRVRVKRKSVKVRATGSDSDKATVDEAVAHVTTILDPAPSVTTRMTPVVTA